MSMKFLSRRYRILLLIGIAGSLFLCFQFFSFQVISLSGRRQHGNQGQVGHQARVLDSDVIDKLKDKNLVFRSDKQGYNKTVKQFRSDKQGYNETVKQTKHVGAGLMDRKKAGKYFPANPSKLACFQLHNLFFPLYYGIEVILDKFLICPFYHKCIICGIHTCHELWTEICEIRQIFMGDFIKFCEIFTKITLELCQNSQKPLFKCKKLVINTTKCDLCLFLHKMCCKLV